MDGTTQKYIDTLETLNREYKAEIERLKHQLEEAQADIKELKIELSEIMLKYTGSSIK